MLISVCHYHNGTHEPSPNRHEISGKEVPFLCALPLLSRCVEITQSVSSYWAFNEQIHQVTFGDTWAFGAWGILLRRWNGYSKESCGWCHKWSWIEKRLLISTESWKKLQVLTLTKVEEAQWLVLRFQDNKSTIVRAPFSAFPPPISCRQRDNRATCLRGKHVMNFRNCNHSWEAHHAILVPKIRSIHSQMQLGPVSSWKSLLFKDGPGEREEGSGTPNSGFLKPHACHTKSCPALGWHSIWTDFKSKTTAPGIVNIDHAQGKEKLLIFPLWVEAISSWILSCCSICGSLCNGSLMQ